MASEGFSIFTSLRFDPIFENCPENAELEPGLPRQFFLLSYHRDRLLHSAQYFHSYGSSLEGVGGWGKTIHALNDLHLFGRILEEGVRAHMGRTEEEGPFRVRVVLPIPPSTPEINADSLIRVECNSTPSLLLSVLIPHELPRPAKDDNPENPGWTVHIDTLPTTPSPITSHKTILRQHYNTSRERCDLPPFGSPNATNEVILYNPEGELMEGSFTSVHVFRDGEWVTPPLISGGCEATIRRWLLEKEKVVERVVRKEELKKGEWILLSNSVRGVWGGWLV